MLACLSALVSRLRRISAPRFTHRVFSIKPTVNHKELTSTRQPMSSPHAQLSSTVPRTRLDTSWPGLQRLELTSTSNLLRPLSLAPLPAPSMLIFSMPLTSLTTSSLPVLAHERATSPLFQASAFPFRSFPLLLRLPLAFAPSGNKRHHHHHQEALCDS